MSGILFETEEHQLLRKKTAEVAARYGSKYFSERSLDHSGIDELWADLGSTGLLSVHLPTEYGGGGKGVTELAIVVEELAAHGMTMLNLVISPAICGSIIAEHGSDEMKQEWLPGLADGSKMMAFALTEPNAGSNTHELETTATRTETGWKISGTKHLISNADRADAVLLAVRDGDVESENPGRNPLTLLVVPRETAGFSYERLETAVISPWWQFVLNFDEAEVAENALIGEAGKGLRQVFAGLNPERILAAAISSGLGRHAIQKAADYAKERQVWSTPIGAHQGVAHPLAEAHINVEIARVATFQAARLHDDGQDSAEAANFAKFAAAEASLKALDQAMQTHGGLGLSKEVGLSDLWFAARLMRTAPVSREMVLNFVAQTSLGLPRSY